MCKAISTLGLERIEWLKLRKGGIGGSDAGAICGLNPYVSPMAVYHDKTTDNVENFDNEAMRQGRDLEEYVAQRFTEETGLKVRRSNKMYWSETYPFMYADVDRLIVGEDAGLECKTVSPYGADKWKDGAVPKHYLIQCFHYMIVTGKKTWYIAAVIFGQEFVYRKIEWDEALAEYLIAIESDFWANHVAASRMPDPDGSESCSEVLEEYFRKHCKEDEVPLSVDIAAKLDRRQEIVSEMKKLDKEKTQLEQEVKVFLDNHEVASNERYRVSWKLVTSDRLNTKLLKMEQPEIYRKYLQNAQSSRFTVKELCG